jgi:hypothetical protein
MKTCLVIMPIGSDLAYRKYLKRYEKLIKPAIEGVLQGAERVFNAIRADFISASGSINRTILRQLYQADVVVADLTDLNPNVFYELGVRHSLRKGTILVALEGTKIPFDVGDLRVEFYEDCIGGETEAIPRIQALLRNFVGETPMEDSPVFLMIPELDDPSVRNLADIKGRASSLEKEVGELRANLADLPPIFSPRIMRLSPVFVRLHQRC